MWIYMEIPSLGGNFLFSTFFGCAYLILCSTKLKHHYLCRYKDGKEPIPQDGIYKGLSVILDLHTDFLATSSVDEDFHGFVGSGFPIKISFPI